MSWTQGGPAVVKVRQTHRHHDAGEARDGGAVRKHSTGDETSGGLALREAGARPHPTEPSARAGVD